ncbi:MAG: DUF1801 domain-containing protein [Flavipsychrobacter sp.]|nr:DUF1801 domain-containing protein [Flavipsychrobacter sp.]
MAEKKSKPAEIKTKPTEVSVADFVNAIADEHKRADTFAIIGMMSEASGEEAVMWGSSIIGFGNRKYKSPNTGREVDWMKIGFSPRKANFALYLLANIHEDADTLKKLGKHKTGKGCLYINKLTDVDLKVLKGMIAVALEGK